MSELPAVLTPSEVHELLNGRVSDWTIREWGRRGILERLPGRRVLFTRRGIEALLGGGYLGEITESEKRAIVQRLHEKLEAVEAVRPETDIDPERLARALDAYWARRYPLTDAMTARDHENAVELAAAYRATPLAERPE